MVEGRLSHEPYDNYDLSLEYVILFIYLCYVRSPDIGNRYKT
jgi:hypothetical protein